MIQRKRSQSIGAHAHPTTVAVTQAATTTTIVLGGAFVRPGTGPFNNAMSLAVQSKRGFIADLRCCTGCDFAALQLLVRYKTWLGDRFQIVVAESGSVRRSIEVCGVSRVLGILTSVERAQELLEGAA
jgi:hypothetical protein